MTHERKEKMYYRHDLDYKYPERSDQHMLELKRKKTIALDKDYEYMPKGVLFRIKRALVATVLHIVVFPPPVGPTIATFSPGLT